MGDYSRPLRSGTRRVGKNNLILLVQNFVKKIEKD
jgi:hypothetical protein